MVLKCVKYAFFKTYKYFSITQCGSSNKNIFVPDKSINSNFLKVFLLVFLEKYNLFLLDVCEQVHLTEN